ncbi:hypothetical protein [Rhodococcus opacus]|uniref:NADPH-dependent FMN reductase n=1 Tax=Rhodococcus opacus M213 TaxID=1129896 RepID=K8XBP1_RHOOP|nr:hypothetical protein [Rhodococcus opacus]EKT78844.1 NADPH-dependent FMN reductase [Rhodococcus opacus M213]MDJ0419980.1 hypothetical protein [Rhodococcus opacus]MDV6245185.1 hypothetical protein [Rhodococcus opacus]MDV7088918.1 hypothetical protein [Rhodococcus opacus]WKN60142.1 hypothetical protein HJ581_0040775 [Rhodococcus opacus]
MGQQSLRAVLSFSNARQMTAPEAYITFDPEIYGADGAVSDEPTAQFLRGTCGSSAITSSGCSPSSRAKSRVVISS